MRAHGFAGLARRFAAHLALTTLLLACAAQAQPPQPPRQHVHPKNTLFAATLSEKGQGVDGAVATGVFVLSIDAKRPKVDYELAFDAIPNPPTTITLRNFAEGGTGAIVHVVCGGDSSRRCPTAASGVVTGTWSAGDNPALTLELTREMANMRIYAELSAGSFAARGQLQGHWTMAPYRAYTTRFGGPEGGVGALIVSMIGSRRTVFYSATVTSRGQPITELRFPGVGAEAGIRPTVSRSTVAGKIESDELQRLGMARLPALLETGKAAPQVQVGARTILGTLTPVQ
jgi:hypothetical protein